MWLGFVVSWKRLPFDFVRRSNDDMILCEIQLSYRMFIKTISSNQCLSLSLSLSLSLLLSLLRSNVHFSFLRFWFWFRFQCGFDLCALHGAHAYLHRTILCFIGFHIPAFHSSQFPTQTAHCFKYISGFIMFFSLFLSLSLSPFFSLSFATICSALTSISLMMMILRVFDKPNDWWNWQYQTWKSSYLFAPLWLLQCQIIAY